MTQWEIETVYDSKGFLSVCWLILQGFLTKMEYIYLDEVRNCMVLKITGMLILSSN